MAGGCGKAGGPNPDSPAMRRPGGRPGARGNQLQIPIMGYEPCAKMGDFPRYNRADSSFRRGLFSRGRATRGCLPLQSAQFAQKPISRATGRRGDDFTF
jgi:hypothetical protein